MDIFLFEKINGLANASRILDFIGIFLADYFQYFLVVVLLILFIWKRNRLMISVAGISIVLSRLVITEIVKNIYHQARPYVILETAKKIITENADYKSFPSGHAAIFFAIATAVYSYNKKLGIFFFISAILICFARIYCGVHWPTDFLAGAVIGIVSGVIINKIMKITRTKTRVVPTSVGTH